MDHDMSQEDAIRWAWYMREYAMRKREEPKEKKAPYRIANPELCKELK